MTKRNCKLFISSFSLSGRYHQKNFHVAWIQFQGLFFSYSVFRRGRLKTFTETALVSYVNERKPEDLIDALSPVRLFLEDGPEMMYQPPFLQHGIGFSSQEGSRDIRKQKTKWQKNSKQV